MRVRANSAVASLCVFAVSIASYATGCATGGDFGAGGNTTTSSNGGAAMTSSTSSTVSTTTTASTTITSSTSSTTMSVTGGAGGTGTGGTGTTSSSATGGTGTTTMSGSGGMGGTGPAPCATIDDCPAPPNACVLATCVGGGCGTANLPSGSIVSAEPNGDCKKSACDGNGHVVTSALDTDTQDDGKGCTYDVCTGGVSLHPFKPTGTACAETNGKVCDGAGLCVGCNGNADCGGSACVAHVCSAAGCADGAQNNQETDIDCGGSVCPKCATGKACTIGANCQSGICTNNVCG